MHWWNLQRLKSRDPKSRLKALQRLCGTEAEANVPILLKALGDSSADVRRLAASELGFYRDPGTLPSLRQLLQDPEPAVREAAVTAVRRCADPSVVPDLEPLIKDPDSRVRYRAAVTLETFHWSPRTIEEAAYHVVALGRPDQALGHGERALPALLLALGSSIGYKRQEVLHVLSQISSPDALKAIIGVLQRDPDVQVRTTAVEALGEISDPQTVPFLLGALKDKESPVRASAAEALARIGEPGCLEPLIQRIHDDSLEVRTAAVQNLGRFHDLRALAPLTACLTHPEVELRRAAALSLGALGAPSSLSALIRALTDENDNVRHAAAVALRMINSDWESTEAARHSLPELELASRSPLFPVRQAALAVIERLTRHLYPGPGGGSFGDPERAQREFAFAALSGGMLEPDSDLRLACAQALGKLGEPRATDVLLPALDDPDRWVAAAAADALRTLRWTPAADAPRGYAAALQRWDASVCPARATPP